MNPKEGREKTNKVSGSEAVPFKVGKSKASDKQSEPKSGSIMDSYCLISKLEIVEILF